MSTEIENRIVQIQFNNKDFEKNVAQTIESLNRFEKSLRLEDAEKGFKNVENAAKTMNFDSAVQSVSILTEKFTALEVIGISALNNLVNKAMDMGTQLVKSLSVDQLTQGFTRYEQKLNSTRTMMNATGLSMEEVNAQVERLMWYTDETSYSFDNMIANVAKFTSANIDAETSMTMIMGIGNAAGLAGVNAEKASHAMDGFAKAVGRGYMDLQNWSWIRTANMDTIAIKQHFIEAAYSAGMLTKDLNGVYRTLKGTEVAAESFEATLSEKWLNKDVIKRALADFGSYSDQIYQIVEATGMKAAEAIEYLNNLGVELSDISRLGFEASQEYKTFTDAVEATKDAVKSGWSRTYENLFGTLEEAKELWTAVGDELYSIFAEGANERNRMLAEWKEAGGRLIAIEGISKLYEGFKNIVVAIKDGFRDMFPKMTSERLLELTKKFRDFASQIQLSNEALFTLRVIVKALLVPFRALFEIAKVGVWVIGRLIVYTSKLVNNFLSLLATGNPIEVLFRKLFGDERYERMAAAMTVILDRFTSSIKKIGARVGEFIKNSKIPEKLISGLQTLVGLLGKAGGWLLDKFLTGLEMLANFNFQDFKQYFIDLFERMPPIIQNVVNGVINLGKTIAEFFRKLFAGEIANPFASLWESIKKIPQSISKMFGFGNDIEETSERTSVLRDGFIKVKDALVDFISQLTPGKVIVFAFGAAIAVLTFNLIGITNAIKGIANGFQNLISGANAVFKGLKNLLNASKLVKIATAILILVGALAALTALDPDRVVKSAIALSMISGVLIITMAAMTVLFKFIKGKDPSQVDKNIKSFLKMMGGMMNLAIAVAAMAGSLAIMSLVDIQDIWTKLAALGALAVGVIAATLILNKAVKNENELKQTSLSFISFGLTIATIVGALKRLDGVSAEDLKEKAAILGILLIVIAIVSRIMNVKVEKENKLKKIGGVITLLLSLVAMVFVLKKLQNMDLSQIAEDMKQMWPLAAALGIVALAARVAGKSIGDISKSILSIVAGITLIQYAIGKLGSMDRGVLIQGGIAAVIGIGAFIGVIRASILGEKQTMKSISGTILSIAAAINLLVLAIYAIGDMDPAKAALGAGIVAGLIAVFALVVAASKNAQKATGTVVAIAYTITVLTVALSALTMLPIKESLIATAEIGAVLLALGFVLRSVSKIEKMKVSAIIGIVLTIISAVGSLAGALYLLSKNDWKSVAVSAGAMSVALLALAGSMKIMTNVFRIMSEGSSGIDKNGTKVKSYAVTFKGIGKAIVAILGVISVIVGAVGALSWITTKIDTKIDALLAMAGSAAILLVGLGYSVPKIMNAANGMLKYKESRAKLTDIALFIGEIVFFIGIIVSALAGVSTQLNMTPVDWGTLGVMTICISILTFISAIVGKILTTIKTSDTSKAFETLGVVSAYIAVMSAIMLGLGSFVTWLSGNEFGQKFIQNAELAMAALIPVSLIFWALAAIIKGISKIKMPEGAGHNILSFIGAMMGFFLALAAGILGLIVPIGAVILAVSVIAGFIAGIDNLVRDLFSYETGLPGLIDTLGDFFASVGDAIGRFFGSIIGGFVGAIAGDDVAEVTKAIEDVVPLAEKLEPLAGLANADIATGAENFGDILGHLAEGTRNMADLPSNVLQNLGAGMEALAPSLAAFSFATKDIDSENFKTISEGILDLAKTSDLFTGYYGGSMTEFGEELIPFSEQLSNFGTAAAGITTWNAIETATSHLEAFIAAISDLTVIQGDFSTFVNNITTYGQSLVQYAGWMADVSDAKWDGVKKSADASSYLVKMANTLNRSGGVIGFFAGQSDIGKFGENLEGFGKGLAMFVSDRDGIGSVTDWSVIEPAVDAIMPLTELAEKISDSSWLSNITYFGAQLAGLGQSLASFFDNLNGKTFDRTPFDMAKQVITEFFTVAELDVTAIQTAGQNYASNFVAGFTSMKVQFADSGKLVCVALVEGVDAKTSDVYAAGWKLGDVLIQGYRTRVQEHSPPETFIRSGKFVAIAINEGATSTSSIATVRDAGEVLGTTLVDSVGNEISNIGSPNIDFNPLVQKGLQTAKNALSDKQNQNGVVQAGNVLGTTIINAVEETLGTINGEPSLITTKDGRYIVQGLTNGITSDMSAEEAAKKKAENIISAFEEGLEKASSKSSIAEKEKELWEALNPNATDTEKNAKEYELLAAKVPQQLERLKLAQAQLRTLKESGFATQEQLQESYTTLLEEETAYAQLVQQMLELERSVETDYNSARVDAIKAEYDLWEKTEGLTANASQKAAKQNELYQAQLDLQAKAVQEAEKAYNSAVEKFGEDTTEAYRARKTLAEANLQMWNIAKEWSELITGQDLQTATQDAQSRYYELLKEYTQPISDGTVSKDFIEYLKEHPMVDESMYEYLNNNLDMAKASETEYYSALKDYYNWADQKAEEQESMWNILKRQGFTDEEIYEHLREESGLNAVKNVQNMVDESMSKARANAETIAGDQMSQLADGLSVISADAVELGLSQGIADGGYKGIQNGVDNLFNSVDVSHIIGEALANNLDISFATRYVAQAGSSAGSAYGTSFATSMGDSLNDLISGDGGVLTDLFGEIKGAILGESEDGDDTVYGGFMGLVNNLIGGFTEGFTADNIKTKVGDVVKQFGLDGILNPFMQFFGINSPSRVFMEMAQYCIEGFLLGITNDQAKAMKIMEEFGIASIDEMNGAIAQAKSIADQLNEDYTPVITPIVDSSEVERSFRLLQESMGKKTFSIAIETQSGIRSSVNDQQNQNGTTTASTGTTVNYTQNNYSPTALSRTEIYRDGKLSARQLAAMLNQ